MSRILGVSKYKYDLFLMKNKKVNPGPISKSYIFFLTKLVSVDLNTREFSSRIFLFFERERCSPAGVLNYQRKGYIRYLYVPKESSLNNSSSGSHFHSRFFRYLLDFSFTPYNLCLYFGGWVGGGGWDVFFVRFTSFFDN